MLAWGGGGVKTKENKIHWTVCGGGGGSVGGATRQNAQHAYRLTDSVRRRKGEDGGRYDQWTRDKEKRI